MNAEAKPDRSGAATGAGGTGAGAEAATTYDNVIEGLAKSAALHDERFSRGAQGQYERVVITGFDDPTTGACPVAGCTGHPANTGPCPVLGVRYVGEAARRLAERALPAGDWHETMPSQLVEARRVIAFDVHGTPAPKGSMRAVLIRGHARLLPGGSDGARKAEKRWARDVRNQCAVQVYDGSLPTAPPFAPSSALYVSIVFHVRRPKAAAKRPRPNTRPDVDKLARSTLDALTGVLWTDDGRIADLVVSKRWAEPGCEGARITVREAVVP